MRLATRASLQAFDGDELVRPSVKQGLKAASAT